MLISRKVALGNIDMHHYILKVMMTLIVCAVAILTTVIIGNAINII